MSKKIGLIVALVGICALSLFLINCGSSSSRPSALLYVLTQGSTGVGNNVTSYAIDENSGNLSLINSNASTCTPAGETCGLPLQILLDPTGAVAFVLNQGVPSASVAPTIYGFKVNSDGSLGTGTAAATLTVGDIPVAMTLDAGGNFLYVIDQGSNPTPTNPACPHTPTSAVDVCPSISVFAATPGSTSLSLVGSPTYLSKIPSALSALVFPNANVPCGASTAEDFLYVTNNHDLSQSTPQYDSTISVYCVDSSGNLTDLSPQLPNPPYVTQGDPISVQAVNTNLAGQANTGGVFVYVGSQPGNGAGTIGVFQMCTTMNSSCTSQDVDDALLVPVGTTPTTTGENPVAMIVDPTSHFLYVLCYMGSNVWGYSITASTSVLTSLNPPNLTTGSLPVSMAFHPSVNNTGQFLYTSNSGSNNISGWILSTTTGAMSALNTVIAPETPSGMAAH
jgi:6-phosphogluconolactonase (cycloisomerase 2 family)